MRYIFLRYPEGKTKAVTFSYDDGNRSDITMAEIMKKHGIKGTFNVWSDGFDATANLTVDEIKTHLLGEGFEIAGHGMHHLSAARLRPIRTVSEVLDCRIALEKTFGGIIRGYAYPDTGFTREVGGGTLASAEATLKTLDIAYARVTETDPSFMLPADWLAWKGTVHGNQPEVDDCIQKFLALDVNTLYPSEQWPRLFYMWGHSTEFMSDWSRLESICERLGGKEDTWYATNMEIYHYCHAYEQLIWSADGLTVSNPTLTDLWVWISDQGKTVKIPFGTTVVLE